MEQKKYTIGIDFGTLSGRAVLVDVANGKTVADAVSEYAHAVIDETLPSSGARLPADFALQDPQDYLDVLDVILPAVLEGGGVSPRDVIGLSVDFTTCTVLPIDGEGRPLCFSEGYRSNPHAYVKLWKHHAAQPYADRINALAEERKEAWLPRTGGRVSSEYLLPKIWETLDLAPEVFDAADAFVDAGDWITLLLTGKLTRGYSFAAYKGQYLPECGWPSRDFLSALDPRLADLAESKLRGKILYAGERAGSLTEEAARRYGLCPGIAVACPMPDAHVASPGMKQCRAGDMFGILGTSSCFMLIDDKDVVVPGICGNVLHGLVPGFYSYEAGLCCMGDHFAWVCENAVSPDYVHEAEERGLPMIRLLCEKAAKQKPGEHGLIALNWWNGNRNPLIDSSLSGLLVGMNLRTKPEDILRALIEATAYGTRILIENYEKHGIAVRRFTAGGGIARKDPFTMQLYADVLKLDVEVADSTQIPALSSAIYAAVAAGKEKGGYDTIAEASEKMGSPVSTVYHPNPEASRVYDRLYREYCTLFSYFGEGGNDVMKDLRRIRAEESLEA